MSPEFMHASLEGDLARLPEHERAEQDASLQELPDLAVPERVALVFSPQDEWAAFPPAGATETSLPRDHRAAATRAVAEPTCVELRREVDEVVCATTPDPFYAVGLWYEEFTQTTDDEVRRLLERAARERPAAA